MVEALLSVVSPTDYVANLSSLRELAESKMERISGRQAPDRHVLWRGWWEGVREGFVGMRRRVEVTTDNAHLVQITMEEGERRYRIHGEGLGVSQTAGHDRHRSRPGADARAHRASGGNRFHGAGDPTGAAVSAAEHPQLRAVGG